jgi:hypothetical protein
MRSDLGGNLTLSFLDGDQRQAKLSGHEGGAQRYWRAYVSFSFSIDSIAGSIDRF